ncbi:MAG: antibiotic biosynthesis monooxygenase [Spirochaetales bacterium]|nr:antibiotic biosynthesis monooxygenase [Spirochaetales bacterium]
MVLIIAKQVVKADKVDEFLEVTKSLIAGSNNEEGCIEYVLYRDQKESNIFHFVEKWKNRDAIKAHKAAPHYVAAGPKLKLIVEASEVSFHDPV